MNPYRGVPVAFVLCACTVVPLLAAAPAAATADGLVYTPRVSAGRDTVKPSAPAGVAATYRAATGKAKVTWSGNKERDLAGYRVYRRLKGSTDWEKLATTKTTSHTDAPPPTGETYYYEVRAHDRAGNTSKGSADRSVTSVDRTPPRKPSGLTAADGQPGIALAWKPVSEAKSYVVHRRWDDDGGDNPLVKVATVASPSWLDATAKEDLHYSYWVTAVDGRGNASAKSAPARVARGDHAPSAPTGLKTTTRATGVELTWKAPASPIALDLTRYRIYRGSRLVDEVSARQTSFTDTRVKQGTSYAYTVTAVDQAGHQSARSAPATGTAPATGLAPAPVTGLEAAMTGTEIGLTWARSPEDDVDRYHLYRGLPVDGAWQYELWADVRQSWEDEPTLSHFQEIYDLQGGTVRWAVVAVDRYGNSRFDSGEDFSHVEVIEPHPAP
ncbi:fibronectin type III domain-containing protein [Streptomyces jumonjinensis]|uniref:fibronectin type III domain-containing protein n=1 Tax=Streptomyces jumonjinensis TaxID=1945 RepID=UPI0037B5B8CF